MSELTFACIDSRAHARGAALGADEPFDGDLTAREVADSAAGVYEVPLRWRDRRGSDPRRALTEHETVGRISLTPDLSTARRVARRDCATGSPCDDTVELVGTLTLKTTDGAFDEVLQVQLYGGLGAVSASGTLSVDELRGTYAAASLFAATEPAISIRAHFERARGAGETVSSGDGFLYDEAPDKRDAQEVSASVLAW